MRINYKILTGFLLCSICLSCEELVNGDGDINVNPNNFTTTGYENVLVTAEVGQIILHTGENTRRAGIFAGTHTGIDRQHEGFTEYTLTTDDFDDLWDDVFINSYRNAVEVERLAREEGIEGTTIGIAQVLQALSLGTAASLYGDLPVDDLVDPAADNPAFEPQAQVYDKMQTLLDEAIGNLQSGTGRPANGADIYFNGNSAPWLEVAWTLKARFFMHTEQYGEAYSAAQNGISSFENSLYSPHTDALTASNLNWQFFANGTRGPDLVVSDFIVSLVNPQTDNPIAENYRGNAKTNEAARYNFLFEFNDVGFQPNQSDEGFGGQTTSAPMVTYMENLLILAEAGARSQGFDTGLGHLNDFREFMNNGGYLANPDSANLQYEAYETVDFENGGIENADNIARDNSLLREILEERYITLFSQIEVFNDTRRTLEESAVRVQVQPNTGNQLPERFLYPNTEINRNSNIPSPIPGLFEKTPINQ